MEKYKPFVHHVISAGLFLMLILALMLCQNKLQVLAVSLVAAFLIIFIVEKT